MVVEYEWLLAGWDYPWLTIPPPIGVFFSSFKAQL
jgi:hypothetical protein